jgi:predicted DNA-binding transcriptional regulator AlpA
MKLWTAGELARKYDVYKSTVCRWLRQGRFPNAYKEKSGKSLVWVIPETDAAQFAPPACDLTGIGAQQSAQGEKTFKKKRGVKNQPLTKAEIAGIVAFYRKGATRKETSIKFNLPPGRITKILKAAGVQTRRFTISKAFLERRKAQWKIPQFPQKKLILRLYRDQGLPLKEIYRRLNIGSAAFYRLLKYYEIPKRGFYAKKRAA